MNPRLGLVALLLVALSVAAGVVATPVSAQDSDSVTLRFNASAVGQELNLAQEAAKEWEKRTGNKVVVLATPNSTTDRLALYQQQLAAESPDIDVYQVDVIWPGLLERFFLDLGPHFSAEETAAFFPRIIANNTVRGSLVAIPWFTDAGLLYYRPSLLAKYGYDGPPETWIELKEMAASIMEGERAENTSFWGFVFQGNSYEGLTCDALEWIFAHGGGTIIDADGNVTINNERAAVAVELIAGMINTIAPPGVLSYTEEEARGIFQTGNAAFMRNWPYAIALCEGPDSPIRGDVGVVVLPRGDGPGGQHAATLGGWQLAVSRYSRHPEQAVDFVRFLTSYDVQKQRALESYLPTRPAVYDDADVLARHAWMAQMPKVFENAVARPSGATRSKYNRVSNAFWTSVQSVLNGSKSGREAFGELERELTRIKGRRDW
jgi:trehalose/maltose transport system substrate-binding protein